MKNVSPNLFSFRPITWIVFSSLILAVPLPALAITKNWSTSYATTGAITIPAGETVVLDTNLSLKSLTIYGKLVCANKNLNVQSNWIMVHGEFECGNWRTPYLHKLNLTLTGNNPAENIMQMGTKVIGVMRGGKLFFTGAPRKLNWTRLNATVRKGATQLGVQGTIDWKPGEKLVIASTDFRPEHAEELTVTAVMGNTIKFAAPLKYDHWCQQEAFSPTQNLVECAEVGLLSHNITIQGDAGSEAAGFGGHMMVMAGGSAKLANIELARMGQKSRIARYPMHWHLVGDGVGQYLMDSSIHNAYNRFVSIHGTHYLNILRNVAYKTFGHGYYLEDGIEQNNLLARNLGLSVFNAADGKPTPSDREASVFWISNPNNLLRYNVAAGSEHTGFWLGFPEHPIGLSATNAIWPRRTPLGEFDGNVSHSNSARGLYVDGGERADRSVGTTWYEPRRNPADEKSVLVPPTFKNFTAYKNRNEGVWIRSFAGPILANAKLADNWMGAYFANIQSGPAYTNVGIIQNALVVGETPNLGNPETWETKGIGGRELPRFWSPGDSVRGLEFYDGPMTVRSSLFANFQSNSQRKAGGLTSLAPNPFWVSARNSSEAIRFVNANRVYLHSPTVNNSGDAFSTFLDKDGSVSGVAGAMIVPNNPVLITSKCSLQPAWNAYVCPYEYNHLQMMVHSGENPSGMVLQRDDGANIKLYSTDQSPNTTYANIIVGRPHSVQFPTGTPKHVSFVVAEKAGKPLRLSMPYPASSFSVTLWGYPVEKASSLVALTTGGHKYFYDGSRLHLRLVSQQGNWEEIQIKRP
jgi:G8 domain